MRGIGRAALRPAQRNARHRAREGSSPGMSQNRTFHIRRNRPGRARALEPDRKPDAVLAYPGTQQSVKVKR